MLKVVAFRKAIFAGAAGALAWDVAARALALSGVPVFDLVRQLGTLAFPNGSAALWWPAGVVAHLAVGAGWALFYAYFFWARLRWPPALQGLAFAALPALLAIFLMVPQLQLMHLGQDVVQVDWRSFVVALEPPILATIVLGHALFGLTVGAIYTRPVGYRVGSPPGSPYAPRRRRRMAQTTRRQADGAFMFATGIECSYPTVDSGRWRRDEMASMRHYELWQLDFELARELGVTHLRYGPPLHLTYEGPGRYRWDLIDEAMAELEALGPEPMLDLCHFGVPSWLGNFQNPDVGEALAEYATVFARRYPWVRFYTPVNEMYVCARMSALDGVWNEQLCDETAFITASFNLAAASVAMTDALLAQRPDAIFVNSESSEFYQPCCPDPAIRESADIENERRFLPLDLLYAHEVSERMLATLTGCGRVEEYRRFLAREVPRRTILGVDYYEWNEKLVDQDGRKRALGELFGWYVIASQYWQRYRRPMMHTETNRIDASDAPRWLWRQWHNVQLLRGAGVPLVGFTWYSLTDQIDWGSALVEARGAVDPVGLFDLNRDPRAVGLAYMHLIEMHRDQPEYRHCRALKELLD
ncbi:MAG TPA: family 1 glycosylhydrolase [Sphingomicrobium sp.]|nr:family 1 glycosylhydrolase [Sphingomicrobium sp.]